MNQEQEWGKEFDELYSDPIAVRICPHPWGKDLKSFIHSAISQAHQKGYDLGVIESFTPRHLQLKIDQAVEKEKKRIKGYVEQHGIEKYAEGVAKMQYGVNSEEVEYHKKRADKLLDFLKGK